MSSIETVANPAIGGGADSSHKRKVRKRGLGSVNRELWLLLAMFAIALLLNLMVAEHRMLLGVYVLPTIFSAYYYGRRHAVLTALASVFLILALAYVNPIVLGKSFDFIAEEPWFDFMVWGGTLLVIAYLMGTLYDRKEEHLRELRQSYEGILMILQHIASDNKYSQNHPFRVSLTASKIAEQMELGSQRVEDVRAAALLHEIDKVGISNEMLYQAANMTPAELDQIQASLAQGRKLPPAKGGALWRIIPTLLAHHALMEKAEQSQLLPNAPLEARILLVSDVYDSLTSAKNARISPSEAMERISQRAGIEYDADVVDAMIQIFRRRGTQPGEPEMRTFGVD
ncbi:MAG: HD domain-containing protein [Acidobacteriia bacterium]|nr:HD domain-containing protein [Terriglobia bacterium]